MMEKQLLDTIHYRLAKIVTPIFTCHSLKVAYETFEIEYVVEPEFKTRKDDNWLDLEICIKGYLITTYDGEKIRTRVLHLELIFVYEVNDLHRYVKNQRGKMEFKKKHKPVFYNLLRHSLSTSTGVLHERLRGTPYHDKLLPIVEPEVFF